SSDLLKAGLATDNAPRSNEFIRWDSQKRMIRYYVGSPAVNHTRSGLINRGHKRMQERARVLVTGAGGFIGHHLVKYLVGHGYWVRGADIKEPEYEPTSAHEFEILDLRESENCVRAMRDIDEVYGLAANMGGIGFIESNKAIIVRDNTLINLQSIEAARASAVKRYLYTSSACVYPGYLQKQTDLRSE